MHASQLEFCIVFSRIVFQAMLAKNVWPPCPKSARAQVSTALLRPDRYICVSMDLYTDDTWASCLQTKGRRCYVSQHIGSSSRQVCQTCSTAPVS